MKQAYKLGYADGRNGKYKNPYSDKTQAALFMEYHNGNNQGAWDRRGMIFTAKTILANYPTLQRLLIEY